MKTLFALLTMSLLVPSRAAAAAPNTETAAVLQVVQEFFDALHARDGARWRAICHPGAQITSGRPAAAGYALRQRPVETDAAHYAETKDTLLERMWSPTVHIDGRAAVVWTRYDFHLNGKFSHNGTDCFTLLKTDQGWKIVCGAYSVEPGGQTENPAGPPR
jgi:hypothetical protein